MLEALFLVERKIAQVQALFEIYLPLAEACEAFCLDGENVPARLQVLEPEVSEPVGLGRSRQPFGIAQGHLRPFDDQVVFLAPHLA